MQVQTHFHLNMYQRWNGDCRLPADSSSEGERTRNACFCFCKSDSHERKCHVRMIDRNVTHFIRFERVNNSPVAIFCFFNFFFVSFQIIIHH